MSTRLEQFMREHRDEFDTEEPREQVWKNLEQQLTPGKKITRPTMVLAMMKWSAAAAILLLAGLGVYSLFDNHHGKGTGTPPPTVAQHTGDSILKDINPTYAQEVYHFTQLIELKQNELKEIEKDHPNLYRKFVTDINKLDSSYIALRKELPANPNREQLLEAMIENLRLQTEILNQQLDIINQIKASKSDSHERNFKTT